MNQTNKTRSINPVFPFMAFFFLAISVFLKYFDNDFYHIVVAGRWMVEHKQIMYDNPYFIFDGYHTIVQQWIYAVILFLFYKNMGMGGVFIFTLLQACLFAVLCNVYIRKDKNQSCLSECLLIVSAMPYLNCRPEIISLILLLLQMICTEKYLSSGKRRYLGIMPLLMVLETNLHCSYDIFHFIVLLPYIFSFPNPVSEKLFLKTENTKRCIRLLFIVPFMLAASCISPYGSRSLSMLMDSAGISVWNISEHMPLSIVSMNFLWMMIGIILVLYLLFKKKLRVSGMLFVIGFSAIAILATKNILLVTLALLSIVKNYVQEDIYQPISSKLEKMYLSVAIFAIFLCLVCGVIAYFDSKGVREEASYAPKEALEYLQSTGKASEIKLYTTYNNGAYFVWNGIGRVYEDPNTSPYVKKINGKFDVLTEYMYIKTFAADKEIRTFLDKYDFDYLYVDAERSNMVTYLNLAEDYECVLVSSDIQNTRMSMKFEEELNIKIPVYYLYRHNK